MQLQTSPAAKANLRLSFSDRGAAVVDFVLVGLLVVTLALSVIQLALVWHVRATLIDCAAQGAQYGALANRTPADAAQRASQLAAASLAASYAQDVTADYQTLDALDVVVVTISAPLPLIGLIGPSGTLTVQGHALRELP